MTPDRPAAGYCPECEHLLDGDDVVRIVGRHMDGLEPAFRCPACDADLAHPSRAPADAPRYKSRSGRAQGSPGSAGAGESRRTARAGRDAAGGDGPFENSGATVVAEQRPPLRLDGVREGDRITVHFDRPGMDALQTKAGDVTAVRRSTAGTPTLVRFETDTRRRCSIDVGPDATLSEAGDQLGPVVEAVVTRSEDA